MLDNFKLSEYLVSDILDHIRPVVVFSIDWKPFYPEEVWFERKDHWDRWRPLQPGPCPSSNQFKRFFTKIQKCNLDSLEYVSFFIQPE